MYNIFQFLFSYRVTHNHIWEIALGKVMYAFIK